MRWFVEASTIGDSAAPGRICVEAAQWQAALETARTLLKDQSPLSKFSIEVLDEGYRAVNPALRLRYVIKRAPPNALLSDEAHFRPSSIPPALDTTTGSRHLSASPPPSLTVPTDAVPKAPQGQAEPARTSEARELATPESADVRSEPPPLPTPIVPEPSLLLRRRVEDATADSPILYCEVVYAVAPGLSRPAVERVLLQRFREVCAELEAQPVRKYVQLAVFDHEFEKRPLRPPLATLAWKDWRGVPSVGFPAFGESAPPPSGTSIPPRAPTWGGSPSEPPSLPHASRPTSSVPPSSDSVGVIRSVPVGQSAPSAAAANTTVGEVPRAAPLPKIEPDEPEST